MKKTTSLIIAIAVSANLLAQHDQHSGDHGVIRCSQFGISRPLRDFFVHDNDRSDTVIQPLHKEHLTSQKFLYSVEDGPEYGNEPGTIQSEMGSRSTVQLLANWPGQNGICPPDPTGAAGLNHYMQAVNLTSLKIFDKSTGTQVGIVQNMSALWTSAPVTDGGDPIILYDKYADRWFISELGANPFQKCLIGISTSNDPSGSYYTYTFNIPSFLDYPKFSIWGDGYYMTYNSPPGNYYVLCFERDSMLAGSPNARAVFQTFNPGPVGGWYAPLPADADGVLPPFGTPCPFLSYSDNAWGSGEIDAVKIWNMSVNWASATPTATVTGPDTIQTSAFDASHIFNGDISQPGTSQKLFSVGGICTFRAQWRSWVGYNTVVLNWGIKLSPTQRSIKWVELRQNQSSGTWSLYQEGIYTPNASSRWVGSIAMDDNGSIALCYAKSSSAPGDFPSLAFTGRLATDPPGQMTFAETMAFSGTGSQQITCGERYGDYSQTSLDPDGITFWHTGEYLSTGGAIRTRIYSFQLPTISGIETDNHSALFSVYQNANLLIVTGVKLTPMSQLVIDLFDIQGRKIFGKAFTGINDRAETSFDVSGIAKGAYLVRIGNEKFQKVIKATVK